MNDKEHKSGFGQTVGFFGGIAALLVATFATFCVVVEFSSYPPATTRATALMAYFTFTVIATIGLAICIALGRLIGG